MDIFVSILQGGIKNGKSRKRKNAWKGTAKNSSQREKSASRKICITELSSKQKIVF